MIMKVALVQLLLLLAYRQPYYHKDFKMLATYFKMHFLA